MPCASDEVAALYSRRHATYGAPVPSTSPFTERIHIHEPLDEEIGRYGLAWNGPVRLVRMCLRWHRYGARRHRFGGPQRPAAVRTSAQDLLVQGKPGRPRV